MKDLFPIPLLHEKITLTKSNLYDQIKARRELKDPGRAGYTSFFDKDHTMDGIDWSELQVKILSTAQTYFKAVIPEGRWPSNARVHAWWNLYGADNHHCWHSHPNSLFSGTYYVHMDEKSVPIEFKSPLESLILSWHSKFGSRTRWKQSVSLKTHIDDLLMWPSWLDHNVPKQKELSDNLRCTISFNIIK